MLETNHYPREEPLALGMPYPGGANVSITFNLGTTTTDGRVMTNDLAFVQPTVPFLL